MAAIVQDVVPRCTVRYMEGGGPDPRCYRVSCDKLRKHLPGFQTKWTVRRGAEELYDAFVRHGLTSEMFARLVRLKKIQERLRDGQLDPALRQQAATSV